MRSLKLFRRADDRPPLKDRLAALKDHLGRIARRPDSGTDTHRRTLMAGSLAAAIPLPALAAAATSEPHPDAELLALGERYERALAVEAVTGDAYDASWPVMNAALRSCPPEAVCSWHDRKLILGGARWPTIVGGNLRHLPCGEDRTMREGWTGEVLRNAIRQAVPRLGRGGETPHHIRRWKALLPIVDAFDAKVTAVDATTIHSANRKAYRAAQEEVREAARAIRAMWARTPEGLAYTVRVAAWDVERGCTPSLNLLASALFVSGVDLDKVAQPRTDA